MADVSRRTFLRHASIGAAATGVLAASGTALFTSLEQTSAGAAPGSPVGPGEVPGASATDVFAHVSDASTGEITVFHGTNAFRVTSPELAGALAKATQ